MSMVDAARQLRKLLEITAGSLTDEQAAELPYCFPVLEEGMEVKEGERYAVRSSPIALTSLEKSSTDNSTGLTLFKCMKTHTMTDDENLEDSELWEVL